MPANDAMFVTKKVGRFLVGGSLSIAVIAIFLLGSTGNVQHDLFLPAGEPVTTQYLSPVELVSARPIKLSIPAIGVEATIQAVGLAVTGTGEMAVPSNFTDVAWYEPGVRPGRPGSAVIAGHYNGRGVPEGVFYNLATVAVGDEVVIVREDQIEDTFQVVKIERYPYNAPTEAVFISDDGKKRLNLITCGGVWLVDEQVYDTRVVVFTELVTAIE